LDDAKAIDEYLDRANEAVVIGGGLIGISVTEALKKRGVGVTVVEMKERILNTILDEAASLMAEERIVQAGIGIIAGHTVSEIVGKDWVTGVMLDDGREISCSLVVVAIGVSPCTKLALDVGLRVNRGIVVDDHMATDHVDIYACGDAVEAYDFIYGASRPTPIWPNAYIGGRVAGQNMAGVETEYAGGTAMNALNYFGLDIASAGMVVPPREGEYEILCWQNGSTYRKAIIKDDLLMGMVFVGDIEKSGIIFGLMRDRVNVGSFKQAILSDDFGLAFLPREIWQERLEMPPEGTAPELTASTGRVEDYAGE
ncbi:MAG: FAD-dependent oxidoreductase, partial [Chloroflexi bacterium]|nr:FAD-dependent oxidoreductase [Chloroflexota bacterium]